MQTIGEIITEKLLTEFTPEADEIRGLINRCTFEVDETTDTIVIRSKNPEENPETISFEIDFEPNTELDDESLFDLTRYSEYDSNQPEVEQIVRKNKSGIAEEHHDYLYITSLRRKTKAHNTVKHLRRSRQKRRIEGSIFEQ